MEVVEEWIGDFALVGRDVGTVVVLGSGNLPSKNLRKLQFSGVTPCKADESGTGADYSRSTCFQP